jgi:hypothetical protein
VTKLTDCEISALDDYNSTDINIRPLLLRDFSLMD